MKRAGEYIDEMRELAANMERLAQEMARDAARGFAPEDGRLGELRRMAERQAGLRGELCALLEERLGGGRDYAALPLEGLIAAAEECELILRMGEEICACIVGAAELMDRLGAPSCGGESAPALAKRARAAQDAGDMDELRALERQAQPYLDLAALLRDDVGAMRGDAALIGRLEQYYPQIAWFMRARARMERDMAAFDDLSDEAVDGLRNRTDEPAARRECRSGRRRPAAQRHAAAQPREHAGARKGSSSGAQSGEDGKADDPEKGDHAPDARLSERADKLLREYAVRYRPGAGIKEAVRARLLAPGTGLVARALEEVRGGEGHACAQALCGRVLIPGQRRGVLLRGLEELLNGLWQEEAERLCLTFAPPGAEWVMAWLDELMPALCVLSDWRQPEGEGGKELGER